MASFSPGGLAVIDHVRQSQQLCANAQLALRGCFQVHDKACPVLLHHDFHYAPGLGEPVDVADGQYTGGRKAGQDLPQMLAFGNADKENVTTAGIVAEMHSTDNDVAPLHLLSPSDTLEVEGKLVVTSNNSKHNRRLRIVKRAIRPFHKFCEVEQYLRLRFVFAGAIGLRGAGGTGEHNRSEDKQESACRLQQREAESKVACPRAQNIHLILAQARRFISVVATLPAVSTYSSVS